MAMIGGKWKARILYLLVLRPLRFADLRRGLGKVSQQVLATQLRQMQADGLVTHEPSDAGSATYTLTVKGNSLYHALLPVADWGNDELANSGQIWQPPTVASTSLASAS